jgi:hypothetical protein
VYLQHFPASAPKIIPEQQRRKEWEECFILKSLHFRSDEKFEIDD